VTAVLHVLWVMFGWPYGIVLGNLIASAIAFVVGLLIGRRFTRRLSRLEEHLVAVRRHTSAVHQAVVGDGEAGS
jgi:hypothetical protein